MLNVLIEKLKNEPVMVSEIIRVATFLLTLAVGFGLLTSEQGEQIRPLLPEIAGLVALVLSVGLSVLARSKVSPVYNEAVLPGTEVALEVTQE